MNLHLTAHALALRQQLAHEDQRMREALQLIAQMSECSTSALTMQDIARIARAALIASPRENTTLRQPAQQGATS